MEFLCEFMRLLLPLHFLQSSYHIKPKETILMFIFTSFDVIDYAINMSEIR